MEEVTSRQGVSAAVVVVIVAIVAIAFGGGMYFYANSQAQSKRAELDSQVSELQNQVSQSGVTATSTTTASAVAATTSEAEKKEICKQLYPDAEYRTYDNDSNVGVVGESICRARSVRGNYAYGGTSYIATETGGPGHGWLAVKEGEKWTNVYSTQDLWECNILEKYNFPSELFEGDSVNARCYDYSTQEERAY